MLRCSPSEKLAPLRYTMFFSAEFLTCIKMMFPPEFGDSF